MNYVKFPDHKLRINQSKKTFALELLEVDNIINGRFEQLHRLHSGNLSKRTHSKALQNIYSSFRFKS